MASGSGHQPHDPRPSLRPGAPPPDSAAPCHCVCPSGFQTPPGLAFPAPPDLSPLPLVRLCLLHSSLPSPGPYLLKASCHHCACSICTQWVPWKYVSGEPLWPFLTGTSCPEVWLLPTPPLGAQAYQAESPGQGPRHEGLWRPAHAVPRSGALAGTWPTPAVPRARLCGGCSWIGCRERTAKLLVTALVSIPLFLDQTRPSPDATPAPRRAPAQWTSGWLLLNSPSAIRLLSQRLPSACWISSPETHRGGEQRAPGCPFPPAHLQARSM